MNKSIMAMSKDFNADVDFDWDEGPPMDAFGPPVCPPGPPGPRPPRNDRYSNAYGNYRGGYGPPGAFGPGGFGGRPGPYFNPPNFMPRGPHFMPSRGFGPGGPPGPKFTLKERVIEYLTRCGVPKEYLRNIPRELARLIQPEFCGVCSMNFNSFSSSRVHYTSKNHLKNQRKFLGQRFENPTKEVPLKSRELYCELCDVEITSKTHAESHYAGKPHRAIVEGRKQPKNPLLLSNRMQDRLEILIRREKKHLKPSEEKADTPANEAKPVDPDLYCDICKTSVTCSDQMTMHLNGKKHLSKEKRHILAMMKGNNDEKTGNGNDDQYQDEEGNGGQVQEEDNDDDIQFTDDQF